MTMDAERVLAWVNDPNRRPSNMAFTAGEERQAAYWAEIGMKHSKEQATALFQRIVEVRNVIARGQRAGEDWPAFVMRLGRLLKDGPRPKTVELCQESARLGQHGGRMVCRQPLPCRFHPKGAPPKPTGECGKGHPLGSCLECF